jgi:hypothetical protein
MTRTAALFLALASHLLIVGSCKKSTVTFADSGAIIGGDPRTAACEGGTFIQIDGHPNPNSPTTGYYDIGSLPSSFHIDYSGKFPIRVKLNYGVDAKCGGNYVDISSIEQIN